MNNGNIEVVICNNRITYDYHLLSGNVQQVPTIEAKLMKTSRLARPIIDLINPQKSEINIRILVKYSCRDWNVLCLYPVEAGNV